MKRPIWKWIACGFVMAWVASPQLHATDNYTPCPPGSTHYKYDNLHGTERTFYAPSGYWYVAYQAKAGSDNQGLGHDPQVIVDPPAKMIVVSHSSGKDLSHVHVCKTKKLPPPPECKEGDPCWCEPDGPGYPCEPPPPQCDVASLITHQSLTFGWTDKPASTPGSACGGSATIVAGETSTVCFDACVNATVNGTLESPGSLPYIDRQCVVVDADGEVVSGDVSVVVSDPEIDNCSATAQFAWAGGAASDKEGACKPNQPCWCELYPKFCEPEPPKCQASARLIVGLVRGHVSSEACFAEASSNQNQSLSIPGGGPWTLCYRGSGGPDSFSIVASVGGNSILLTEPEWTFHFQADWYFSAIISAIGRDEKANCTRPAMIRFEVLTDPPDICLPWLP